MLTAVVPSPGQQAYSERSPLSLWLLHGKRGSGRDHWHCQKHCGLLHQSLHFALALQELHGVLWASATGGVTMMGKKTGVCNNQHMNLGRPCSYLQCPRSTPTSIFAHLQNQVRGKFWSRNSMECRSAWCGSLNMEIWQSESPICPHPGKELNHSPICCRECLSAPFEQNCW